MDKLNEKISDLRSKILSNLEFIQDNLKDISNSNNKCHDSELKFQNQSLTQENKYLKNKILDTRDKMHNIVKLIRSDLKKIKSFVRGNEHNN